MPVKAPSTTEQLPPSERRKNLRKPLLVLRARLDDGRKVFFGYAKNISRSGMFIASVRPRDVGEQFDVELEIPPPLALKLACRCEVIWKREFRRSSDLDPGMGLRFLDLPPQVGETIGDWIDSEEESKN